MSKPGAWRAAFLALMPALAGGPNPFLGTWKMNLEKSKFETSPPPKSSIKKFEPAPNGLKYSGETVTADGTVFTASYTAHFDGKDYPCSGTRFDAVVLRRIDSQTMELILKKEGSAPRVSRYVVSKDGRLLTLTQDRTAEGKTLRNVIVYEKQ